MTDAGAASRHLSSNSISLRRPKRSNAKSAIAIGRSVDTATGIRIVFRDPKPSEYGLFRLAQPRWDPVGPAGILHRAPNLGPTPRRLRPPVPGRLNSGRHALFMATRERVTVDLDAEVAAVLRRHAAENRITEGEILDRAIRAYDFRGLLARLQAQSDLDDSEAMELAREELKAVRTARRAAG